jgi:hypothetical protein
MAALLGDDAIAFMKHSAIGETWNTDCVAQPTTAITMEPALATA